MRIVDLLVVSVFSCMPLWATQGVCSGNCESQKLPPLSAFGSLTVNPHPAIHAEHRLNSHQLPATNRFQNFQHPGAIEAACPVKNGPFWSYLSKTGPALKVAGVEFSFKAKECRDFKLSTDVINSQTCHVNYNCEEGLIRDYHVTGNLFHDVYYDHLTPIIDCGHNFGDLISIKVDGGALQQLPAGSVIKGRSFQLFFKEASVIFFVENAEASDIQFKLNHPSILTAMEPLTGFIRVAAVPRQTLPKKNRTVSTMIAPTALSEYLMTLPSSEEGVLTSNSFLREFNKIVREFFSLDRAHFQEGSRKPPHYRLLEPFDPYHLYAGHRRYIPIRADISSSAKSMTWSYTLSPLVNRGDGSNRTLVGFPSWKHLQGLTPGVVHTIPGGGQPLQNFSYSDRELGTWFVAEAVDGKVTFLEGDLPAWYGTDLFIPSSLTFTASQIASLSERLKEISPFVSESVLEDPKSALQSAMMLGSTGLASAYFFSGIGQGGHVMTISKPFIDNAKSILTTLIIHRTPGTAFFVADRTAGGVCAGEFNYTSHASLAGYALLAAAMVTEWELSYTNGPLWVQLPVRGADDRVYQVSDFIDFLWRDAHNPFQDDPDLPYDRCGSPWLGLSVANGFEPHQEGRVPENFGEDFNGWYGMNAYAKVLLKTPLSQEQIEKYEVVRDFSEINLKMVCSWVSSQ